MPHADAIEQAMIGSILLDHSVWQSHAQHLCEDHFYVPANRITWQAIEQLLQAGMVPDLVTVQSHLENSGQLSAAGGLERLISLGNVPTAAYAESYVSSLDEYRRLRQAAQYGMELQRLASEADSEAVASLMASPPSDTTGRRTLHTAAEANQRLMAQLRAELNGEVGRARPTGIPALDGMLTGGGLRPGQLTVIAARPSMGKSVLAHNFATSAANNWGPVLFCAMEMPGEELQERALAAVLGENPRTVMQREGEAGLRRIESTMPLTEIALSYEDDSVQSIESISRAAHRLAAEQGPLAMIVIDYLQLIEFPRHMAGDPVRALGEISKRLKQLARKLECPVVLLSQLSRAVEKRPDRRPMLSDLRDSGAIEQDADIVIFIYRDHYYNREADPHETEIIVAKQRGGARGVIKVDFNQGTSIFVDRAAV